MIASKSNLGLIRDANRQAEHGVPVPRSRVTICHGFGSPPGASSSWKQQLLEPAPSHVLDNILHGAYDVDVHRQTLLLPGRSHRRAIS